ncbi:MAG: cell division protein FtsQ/DivIB [Myxococcales bacterium]|nr:FtsQ-type POTRA domain-containing protein [Myxococcales bacterium]
MTGFRPVDPALLRRAAAEAERNAFKSALDAALRTLAAAALSAALSLGAWQAWRWATLSPAFALNEIRFSGLSHAQEGDLVKRSGLSLGQNLFRADLANAGRAMESHPWVDSALLTRRLPGTLMVSVLEHHPAALVQLGEKTLYVLDEEGRLFKRAAPEDGLDLPVVTGLSRQTPRPDLQLRLLGALHLLDTWRGAGYAVSALAEVRLDDAGGYTLFAHDGDGLQEIRLGATQLPLKLRRLAQVRAALARRGEKAARIELDNSARPDQAAATLADKR